MPGMVFLSLSRRTGAGNSEKLDDSGQVLDYVRIGYLKLYTNAMREVIARGADVRGYFVWSLLDNFRSQRWPRSPSDNVDGSSGPQQCRGDTAAVADRLVAREN